MKGKIILLLFMISAIISLGQNKKQNLPQEIRRASPQFTGDERTIPVIAEGKFQTIDEYLAKKITYPEDDQLFMVQGTVVAQFAITPTGDITDVKIINSVSKRLDAEVISALESTRGMWKPGKGYSDDQPVAMEKEISVRFKVDGVSNLDFNTLGKSYFAKGSTAMFNNENPHKALKYFDQGITLLPCDKALLVMRGLARYEVGNKNGALQDWNRVKALGGVESKDYLENFENLKGYALMSSILVK